MLTEVFSRKLPTMACLQEIIIQEDPSFSQEATLWEVKNKEQTGGNNSLSGEIQGSINMLLENAVSGFAFGGSDIPGFFGFPSDELYIRFY